MPMNLTRKIISAHLTKPSDMNPGDEIYVKFDQTLTHDINAVMCYLALEGMGIKRVRTDVSVSYLDHNLLYVNTNTPDDHIFLTSIARKYGIWLSLPGNGIMHSVQYARFGIPGKTSLGTDSHTTTHGAFGAMGTGCGATDMATILMTGELWFRVPEIIEVRLDGEAQKGVYPKDVILEVLGRIRADGAVYKAIDFTGSYVEKLNVAGRMTICNMAVEMGAKTAYMQPNADVLNYVDKRAVRPYEVQFTDPDFQYEESYVFDVSKIEPNLACPSSVENVHPLSEVVANGPIKLNQGYIGSCTGGRVEDIAIAAKILKGRHIPEYTRLIVVPASNEVMQECMKAGYIQDLMNAGATITTPGCGACLGAHEGILAPGEVCITSTNRNFPGRMGSTEALMYLASPATVAASMVNGCITDPREFL